MRHATVRFLAIAGALASLAVASASTTSTSLELRATAGTSIVELPDEVVLGSPKTMLTFDRRHGSITRLVDRRSGQDFAGFELQPLFLIFFNKPLDGNGQSHVGAHSFKRVQIKKTDDRTRTLIFDRHPKLELSVRVTARVDNDGGIRLRLAVDNETDLAIKSIQFPHMAWRPVLGEDAADDRLLTPWRDSGELLVSPAAKKRYRRGDYPGMVCAQFAAYYDGRAGLYMASEDADGYPKSWIFKSEPSKRISLDIGHLCEEEPGNDITLTYDVILKTFEGDWRDAAAIYKSWAIHQPWCAKKLTERQDVPQFLKEGASVIAYPDIRAEDFLQKFGKNLERLPDFVSAYRHKTGLAHIVFIPYGWENRGSWAGIHYFPAYPSNKTWMKVAKQLRDNGDRLMLMTSGFWWVVKRQTMRSGPAFDDSDKIEAYKPMLVKKTDGEPWTMDCFDLTKKPRQIWRGLSMHLCHGSAPAQQTIKEIFLQAAKLGCSIVSFDQEQGGRQYAPCYDTTHGHGPGYGPYIWTGFKKTCEAILSEGRAINPELGLCMENTSELAIPYMATYWSRQFRGGFREDLPTPPGVEQSVGLFSYLYHEYTTAIGAACVQGQGDKGRQPSAEVRCFILSNNLCRGLIPGPFARHVPLDPADDWQKTVARAFFSYCQPYARFPEYLVLGETIRPPTIQCAEAQGWVPLEAKHVKAHTIGDINHKNMTATLRFPAVNVGSFKAADGSIGTVLANTTDQEQSATLTMPEAISSNLVLYDSARNQLQQWRDVNADQTVQVTIEPFGTRILVAH